MKKIVPVLTVCLLLFPVVNIYAGDALPDYKPYEENEFPDWAKDLRRAEIIFFGTIPFTFLLSSLSYDFYIYADNDFDSDYAPSLLGNNTPPSKTDDEKYRIIAASVSLSAVLSLVDYLLGKPWNE